MFVFRNFSGQKIKMEKRKLSPRFEVRPKTRQNAILLGVGCGLFTLAGVFIIAVGSSTMDFLAGILSIVFFGGAGLLTIPKLLRREVSMVLTHQGIEQITLYGTATIQWKDVEKIGGYDQGGSKLVGIRFKTYDGYLAGMSPELAGTLQKSLPYLKVLTGAALLAEITSGQLWSSLDDVKTGLQLEDFGQVGSLAQAMYWSRKVSGYDITFSWADLDRPADQFVKLLEQYWQSEVVCA
jgi:hypothetical protein